MKRAKSPFLALFLVLLALGIQFLFSRGVEEPYPSVNFPGFGTIIEENNVQPIVRLKIELIRDDSVEELRPVQVWKDPPHWYFHRLMKRIFGVSLVNCLEKRMKAESPEARETLAALLLRERPEAAGATLRLRWELLRMQVRTNTLLSTERCREVSLEL